MDITRLDLWCLSDHQWAKRSCLPCASSVPLPNISFRIIIKPRSQIVLYLGRAVTFLGGLIAWRWSLNDILKHASLGVYSVCLKDVGDAKGVTHLLPIYLRLKAGAFFHFDTIGVSITWMTSNNAYRYWISGKPAPKYVLECRIRNSHCLHHGFLPPQEKGWLSKVLVYLNLYFHLRKISNLGSTELRVLYHGWWNTMWTRALSSCELYVNDPVSMS